MSGLRVQIQPLWRDLPPAKAQLRHITLIHDDRLELHFIDKKYRATDFLEQAMIEKEVVRLRLTYSNLAFRPGELVAVVDQVLRSDESDHATAVLIIQSGRYGRHSWVQESQVEQA